jgi:hypothetical protein
MKIQKLLVFLVVGLALSVWADDAKKPIDKLLGKCPEGQWYYPNHNECVPKDATLEELTGVSQEKTVEVLERHRAELQAIKGVVTGGVDLHGIDLEVTPDHDKVPTELEGLPVHTHPYAYEVLIGADVPSF